MTEPPALRPHPPELLELLRQPHRMDKLPTWVERALLLGLDAILHNQLVLSDQLATLAEGEATLMLDVSALTEAVESVVEDVAEIQDDVTDAVVALNDLKSQVDSNAGAQAAIDGITAKLQGVHTSLQTAKGNLMDTVAQDDPAPAPAPPSAPQPVQDNPAPVSADPAPTQPGDTATGGTLPPSLPLYQHVGQDPVGDQWIQTSATAFDGSALYTFTGDAPGQPPTGISSEWQPYTTGGVTGFNG